MQKAHILIVEDNDDMREAVAEYLLDKGFVVSAANSAERALEDKLYRSADVAIVDIALPGTSGLELTKQLKHLGYEGSIIALTARDTVDDKLVGLDAGMDDYMVKPFDLRELAARIMAQLRIKQQPHDLAPVNTASFRLDPRRYQFWVHDTPVKLTLVEFRLMRRLMQRRYTTVTALDLIETAWGDTAGTTNPPLRIHISNLRQKINDRALTIIQTVPGVGYML